MLSCADPRQKGPPMTAPDWQIRLFSSVTVALVAGAFVVTPAAADEVSDVTEPASEVAIESVSAADVDDALSGELGGLLLDAAASFSTASEAAVVSSEGGSLTVPLDPSEPVSLSVDGASIDIDLPYSSEATDAVVLESGVVTYPSDTAAANAVVPLTDGVQFLTTIASADAPSAFAYSMELPVGAALEMREDGTAVVEVDGQVILATSGAWAKDAMGVDIPTSYEVVGTTLVQRVEHQSGPYAYPIVADPTLVYPVSATAVVNKSRVSTSYTSPTSFASCKIGTKGGTCNISSGKSATRTVDVSLGISRSGVTSSLGISDSQSVSIGVACSSPPLAAGATWRAYAVGNRYQYKVRKVTTIGFAIVSDVTSGWLYAFDPNPARIYCK